MKFLNRFKDVFDFVDDDRACWDLLPMFACTAGDAISMPYDGDRLIGEKADTMIKPPPGPIEAVIMRGVMAIHEKERSSDVTCVNRRL
jgi:hypothetical protein